MKRKTVAFLFAFGALTMSSFAHAAEGPVRIGVLSEMTSILAAQQGPGDVVAVKMAVSDFGGKVLGRTVEVLSADPMSKPDLGALIARKWYDEDNVQVIVGGATSAIALAVQDISRAKGRVQLNTNVGTTELTGKRCSPTSAQWVFDTYALAKVATAEAQKDGKKSWYFIAPDYAFGHSMVKEATGFIDKSGSKVAGVSFYPSGSPDFSSFLLTAQGSKADILGMANSGEDLVNTVKQAYEFGNVAANQKLVALMAFLTNVKAAGAASTKGLTFAEAFYWDQNEKTREFSKRFAKLHNGAPPTSMQAGAYSATLHYLRAVEAAGTLDAVKVMEKMRELPVNDFMTDNAKLREDGSLLRDMYILRVKDPEKVKGEWDLLDVIGKVSGADAFRPLSESECPYIKK
ncbi:ABC transporter substrate-binding protein [Xanthobacter dioxanivorans]|uniref:ABC transporter substrate-binding protein n=1 Tax=Xanthobacter dioxanivorans TaxID=2528964 RepID=A0A974PJD3_9HYPH|nr:ABC transporter substrate-binding protein [Xanthobacter dioxanivorans]QRG04648.1 ABC transporter substrate-binding protein [Xanthobacter dioxanivorans]